MNHYLAVDIGASSGRHILSWLEDGRMHTREVYRFDNGIERKDGELCWNHDRLFNEIVKGMAICKDIGMIPASDTNRRESLRCYKRTRFVSQNRQSESYV